MDGSDIFYIISAVITCITLINIGNVDEPGRILQKKFNKLGILAGKTESQIIKIAGQPSSFSAMPEGKKLLQWQATGYHIALLFNAKGICEGISHEFVSTI